jgi:hypothetical protein
VSSVFGRTGEIQPQAGDYSAAQVTNAVDASQSYANPNWLASLDWNKISGPPAIPGSTDSLPEGPSRLYFTNERAIAAVTWNALTGKPAAFSPSQHAGSHASGGNDPLSGTLAVGITGNAATATALSSTPQQCGAGQYARGIAVSGAANCAAVAVEDIAGLGNAATKNIGTTAGTVAAGDDPRLGAASGYVRKCQSPNTYTSAAALTALGSFTFAPGELESGDVIRYTAFLTHEPGANGVLEVGPRIGVALGATGMPSEIAAWSSTETTAHVQGEIFVNGGSKQYWAMQTTRPNAAIARYMSAETGVTQDVSGPTALAIQARFNTTIDDVITLRNYCIEHLKAR